MFSTSTLVKGRVEVGKTSICRAASIGLIGAMLRRERGMERYEKKYPREKKGKKDMGMVFFGSVRRVGDVYVTQTKSGGLEADSPPPSRYGESGGPWMGLASPIAGPLDPNFEPDSLNRGRGPRFSESTRDALSLADTVTMLQVSVANTSTTLPFKVADT